MGGSSHFSHEQRRQLVVVALPAEDDTVRQYSSEKEPHLTLLYLGEPDFTPAEFQNVAEYIEHATSLFRRFSLEVDKRGELGDDKADVLFFNKRWAKDIERFRGQLLQNELISEAYHSVEQYPEWLPHLTMGYPETPAKKDTREYQRFSYVRFDRISIWIEDYVGPTFELNSDEYGPEVAMSQTDLGAAAVDEFFHYGVKGMKWGQRRKQKQLAKADRKWEATVYSTRGAIAVHNEVASRMNNGMIDKHNDNPKWRNVDLRKNPKLEKEYYDAYSKLEDKVYKDAVTAVHGKSPSGTKKAVYINDEQGARIEIKSPSARHADEDLEPDLVILLEQDELGQVSEQNEAQSSVEHADPVEEFLAHYGVKGMKWGKRKKSSAPAREQVKTRINGTKIEVKGGSGYRPSDEAVKTAAANQLARKSGVKALTNKDLQDAVTRMNLEQQFVRLAPQSKRQKAAKFASELLLGVGKQQATRVANDVAGQQVGAMLAKTKK